MNPIDPIAMPYVIVSIILLGLLISMTVVKHTYKKECKKLIKLNTSMGELIEKYEKRLAEVNTANRELNIINSVPKLYFYRHRGRSGMRYSSSFSSWYPTTKEKYDRINAAIAKKADLADFVQTAALIGAVSGYFSLSEEEVPLELENLPAFC